MRNNIKVPTGWWRFVPATISGSGGGEAARHPFWLDLLSWAYYSGPLLVVTLVFIRGVYTLFFGWHFVAEMTMNTSQSGAITFGLAENIFARNYTAAVVFKSVYANSDITSGLKQPTATRSRWWLRTCHKPLRAKSRGSASQVQRKSCFSLDQR